MVELTLTDGEVIRVKRILRMANNAEDGTFLIWAASDGPGGEVCHQVTASCFLRQISNLDPSAD